MSRMAAHGLARAVSIALHPFVVFAALTLLATWMLDREALPRVVAGLGVAIGAVWVFVWQRVSSGRWGTVDASRPHERPLLYAVVLVVVVGLWAWLGMASPLARGVAAAGTMLALAGLLNRWIKLSLHMASLAFAGAAAWPLSPWLGAASLALLPLLGWSRLHLRRHAWPEVVGGTVLGALAGMATW